jgi:hypothetical protein
MHLRSVNFLVLNGYSYGIKEYGVEVTFNSMTDVLSFIKPIVLIDIFKVSHRRTDNIDLISLTFIFKEKI